MSNLRPLRRLLLLTAVALSGATQARPTPVRVILVGDSTIANGSGWGDAFCARMDATVTCVNRAIGGRSTSTYRSDGAWDAVMSLLREPDAEPTWVLIQFGHNDQPGKRSSTELATEFPANLATYVDEARSAGAWPVLITPLTRRMFRNGRLLESLAPWAGETRAVAAEHDVPLLDLYAQSVALVQRMGAEQACSLAMAAPGEAERLAARSGATIEADKTGPKPQFDYTHLGPEGARVFSALVTEALATALPTLAAHVTPPP